MDYKPFRLILIIFILFFPGSCNRQKQLSNEEKKEITTSVRKTLESYYKDIKDSGLIAEFKYMDNSAEFFWAPPSYSAALSYDSIAAIIRTNAPSLLSVENTFDTLLIVPLNKDLASYTGRITSTIRDTSQKISVMQLVETGVMIKRKTGWKLLNGQTVIIK